MWKLGCLAAIAGGKPRLTVEPRSRGATGFCGLGVGSPRLPDKTSHSRRRWPMQQAIGGVDRGGLAGGSRSALPGCGNLGSSRSSGRQRWMGWCMRRCSAASRNGKRPLAALGARSDHRSAAGLHPRPLSGQGPPGSAGASPCPPSTCGCWPTTPPGRYSARLWRGRAGAIILEIARSEIAYTAQRPEANMWR